MPYKSSRKNNIDTARYESLKPEDTVLVCNTEPDHANKMIVYVWMNGEVSNDDD